MSPANKRDLRLLLSGAAVFLVVILLAAFLHHTRPTVAKWQEAAQRAVKAHQAHLLQLAHERNERDYIAYVRSQCGDEAWPRPREGALPVCADKRGRGTGQPYTGVHP